MPTSTFGRRVQTIVSGIPPGYVMTYGQIAALAGNARAARIVGGIAHFGNPSLPWHRVVNRSGGLAAGYPGGRQAHQQSLEAEGVVFESRGDEYVVDLETYLWQA